MYISNNIHWMMLYIEQSQKNSCLLTWESFASLVKEAHHNGDPDVMPMVINLENGLRGGKVCVS